MHTLSCFFLCLLYVSRTVQASDTTLKTISIPLTTDSERRYVMQVDMAKQRYGFSLSMSTGYCIVAGTECTSCNTDIKYDMKTSPIASGTTGNNSVQIIGGTLSGGIMLENCSFIQTDGSSWDYINHPMLLATESSSLITPGISGILGLGTNRHNGDFNASGVGMWLSRHSSSSNISFGLQLNPPTASSRDAGMLDWLVPDQTAYAGEISWKTLSAASITNMNSDWVIELDSWNINISKSSSTSRSGGMIAVVEPYLPSLIFPYAEAKSIYDRITGSNKSGTTPTSNLWSIPCQSRMTLTITFGQHSFSINEDYLVQNLNGSCWGSIEGWIDESETLYLLGSTFLSSIYLIASVSSVDQGSLGFAKRAELPRKLQAGTIAGITLGSVACSVLLLLGILHVYRLWRRRRPLRKSFGTEDALQPFILSHPMSTPLTTLRPVGISNFEPTEEELPLQVLHFPPNSQWTASSYSGGVDVFYSAAEYSRLSVTVSPSTPVFSDGQFNSNFATQADDSIDTPPPYTRSGIIHPPGSGRAGTRITHTDGARGRKDRHELLIS